MFQWNQLIKGEMWPKIMDLNKVDFGGSCGCINEYKCT